MAKGFALFWTESKVIIILLVGIFTKGLALMISSQLVLRKLQRMEKEKLNGTWFMCWWNEWRYIFIVEKIILNNRDSLTIHIIQILFLIFARKMCVSLCDFKLYKINFLLIKDI